MNPRVFCTRKECPVGWWGLSSTAYLVRGMGLSEDGNLNKYTKYVNISDRYPEGEIPLIQTVGFMLNPKNAEALRYAGQAAAFLEGKNAAAFDMQADPRHPKPDVIVTFGGDGTLLRGARVAMQYDIPLLGINLGTVGFLTEEEPGRLEAALQAIIDGEYQTESRSLLEIRRPKTGEMFYALNDAVITRGGYARLIRVEAFVNEKEYGVFTADGIIVATPTGSTGYSLSAGGPIVEPGMNCMIITPVCAHSMQHCPCVVSGESRIRLLLKPEREQTAELQIDGQSRGTMEGGDEVLISGTEKRIRLIRLHPYDFFNVVRRKLIEWGS